MKKIELMEVFDKCERQRMGIRVELEMPGQKDPEIIINTYNSLETKKRYYNKTYNDNLVHNKNDKIRIVSAKPIQIRREAKWGAWQSMIGIT